MREIDDYMAPYVDAYAVDNGSVSLLCYFIPNKTIKKINTFLISRANLVYYVGIIKYNFGIMLLYIISSKSTVFFLSLT